MFVGIDGSAVAGFRTNALSIHQGGGDLSGSE